MYNNNYYNPAYNENPDDERFFLAPFLLGGIAGTALGYGISNNNNNQGGYYAYPVVPAYPVYPVYPTCPNCPNNSTNNNYYYYQ